MTIIESPQDHTKGGLTSNNVTVVGEGEYGDVGSHCVPHRYIAVKDLVAAEHRGP